MKKIILYGAGNYCRLLLKNMQLEQYEVVGVVDGDPGKWGAYVEQYLISKPEDILNLSYDEIWIAVKNYQGIAERLIVELQVPVSDIRYCDFDAMQILELKDSGLKFDSSETATRERLEFREFAIRTIEEGLLYEAFLNGEFAGYDSLSVIGSAEEFDIVKKFVESCSELQIAVRRERQITVSDDTKYIITGEDYEEQINRLVNELGCKRRQCLIIPLFDVGDTVLV